MKFFLKKKIASRLRTNLYIIEEAIDHNVELDTAQNFPKKQYLPRKNMNIYQKTDTIGSRLFLMCITHVERYMYRAREEAPAI